MNHDNKPTTAGITIGLPNSSNKGFDIKAGMIDNTNTYIPNNNLKLYDSKDKYNRIPSVNAIVCYIHCDDLISNHTDNNTKQSTIDSNPILSNTESNTNIESTNQNTTSKPFSYEDSNITAKEIINNDNITSIIIESKANLLEYQGNTTGSLMVGISAMFASMAELAKRY